MSNERALPKKDPRVIAWEKYKATEEYAITRGWASQPEHVDGSMWAAFMTGCEIDVAPLIAERDALKARVAEVEKQRDDARAKAEIAIIHARGHAMEARTANASLREAYQAVTGATGEPGSWYGARPIKDALASAESALAASRRQVEGLREALGEIEGLSRHLRHGGCDAMDLAGLEEGLSQAVGLAHDALSALDAPQPEAPTMNDLFAPGWLRTIIRSSIDEFSQDYRVSAEQKERFARAWETLDKSDVLRRAEEGRAFVEKHGAPGAYLMSMYGQANGPFSEGGFVTGDQGIQISPSQPEELARPVTDEEVSEFAMAVITDSEATHFEHEAIRAALTDFLAMRAKEPER